MLDKWHVRTSRSLHLVGRTPRRTGCAPA